MYKRREKLKTDTSIKIATLERWVSIMSEFIRQEEYRRKQRQDAGYDITRFFHSLSEETKSKRDSVVVSNSTVQT